MFWLMGYHPNAPLGWADAVREHEARVAGWIRGELQIPAGQTAFEDVWGAHKKLFHRAQKLKCAYCEADISADANGGDIEHYRPKGEVTKLLADPSTWGDEDEGSNLRDPKKKRQTEPACQGKGYWWLAYAWGNYLLSCSNCNRKWKGTLFPIEGGHRAATAARAARPGPRPQS